MDFLGPIWDVVCKLFNVVVNACQSFEINITDVECVMDKPPEPDGEGGYIHGSRALFRLEIINRKNKKFILSNIHWKALCQGEVLQDKICCCNNNIHKKVAAVTVCETITALDIEPQSSVSYNIRLSLGGDLSRCDELIFYYKPGTKCRKLVVWKQ